MAADLWQDAHVHLEAALDAIEERWPRQRWTDHSVDMAATARAMECVIGRRWSGGVGFALEMHRELDMAARNEGPAREKRLSRIAAALACKHKHQDTLLGMIDELAVATRAMAASRDGGLDPDTADPIVTLRDGLATFNIGLVKEELRALAMPYQFRQIHTHDHPLLARFGAFFAGADFDLWQLAGGPPRTGSIAARHPERFTWFVE